MKVRNVSARLHHVGSVSIAPGEQKDIGDEFANSINTAELNVVEAPVVKAAAATKAPAAPKAPVAPPAPPAAPAAPNAPPAA